MKAYLILKDNAGPWELVRHLFPSVPIKSVFPIITSDRGRFCPCYEVDGDKLTEPQLQALAAAFMWQSEANARIHFELAAVQVKRRFLVSKHWASQVYAEAPSGLLVTSEGYLEQRY